MFIGITSDLNYMHCKNDVKINYKQTYIQRTAAFIHFNTACIFVVLFYSTPMKISSRKQS